jgi:3-oxoacyl-[acyl-carrier protein] reductase
MPIAFRHRQLPGYRPRHRRQARRRRFDIVVNYRTTAEAAGEALAHVEAGGRRAIAVQADVADPAQLRGLFQTTEDHFGRLDAFVGNAAAAINAPIADMTDDDFDHMWRTNTPRDQGLCGTPRSPRSMRAPTRTCAWSWRVTSSAHH